MSDTLDRDEDALKVVNERAQNTGRTVGAGDFSEPARFTLELEAVNRRPQAQWGAAVSNDRNVRTPRVTLKLVNEFRDESDKCATTADPTKCV